MGRFLPPDFERGDPNTVGGYTAVHGRPPAFEGTDGAAYTVEVVIDEAGADARRFGGYLFFVRWRQENPVVLGHVESDYLIFGPSEEEVRVKVGAMSLSAVKELLDQLIAPPR